MTEQSRNQQKEKTGMAKKKVKTGMAKKKVKIESLVKDEYIPPLSDFFKRFYEISNKFNEKS